MLDDKISQDSKAIKETYLASESDIEDVEMTEAPASKTDAISTQAPPVSEHRLQNSTILQNPKDIVPKERSEDLRAQDDMLRLRREHQQLSQRILQSERDKRKLREEYEDLNIKYEHFCSDTSEQLRKAEEKHKSWQLKAKELADELAECKDELFNLQPCDEVTDSQVASEWDTLCQQITRWIDDEAEFVEDLFTRLEYLKKQHQLSPTVQEYWGKDRQLLVNRYKMNEDLDNVLRYNIHCLLETWVFDDTIYLFGLKKDDARLLRTIEHSLSTLSPQRDPTSIQRWRAEALNAMLNLQSFKEVQGDLATEVTREAENILGPLLPRLAPAAMKRFHSHITLSAIDLASNLRRSPVRYYFVYDIYHGQRPSIRPDLMPQKKGRPVNQAERGKVNIVDIDSRKTLKPSQALVMTQDGNIGEEIMLIHPALCCRKGEGDEVVLSKSLHLVKLLAPLPVKIIKNNRESEK